MSKHKYQQGSGHVLLFAAVFVAIVGALGFVGYNAWQKQSANAGGTATLSNVNSLKAQLKKAEASLVTNEKSLAKAQKEKDTAEKVFVKKRDNERKEDKALDALYVKREAVRDVLQTRQTKLANESAELSKLQKNKASNAKIKAQQAVVNDMAAKVAASQASFDSYASQFAAVRNTWPEMAKFNAAKDKLQAQRDVVARQKAEVKSLRDKIATAEKKEKKSKNNNGNKNDGNKPKPVPAAQKRCGNSSHTVNSTKTACYKYVYKVAKKVVTSVCPNGYTSIHDVGNRFTCTKTIREYKGSVLTQRKVYANPIAKTSYTCSGVGGTLTGTQCKLTETSSYK